MNYGEKLMKLFDILKNKKNMATKKMHTSVLGEMWVCTFTFCPWFEEGHKTFIKKVNIISAEANNTGIMVKSIEPYPFGTSSVSDSMTGYIGKFTSGVLGWTGFFETEEEAKRTYNELMIKWCDVIKSKIKKVQ